MYNIKQSNIGIKIIIRKRLRKNKIEISKNHLNYDVNGI